MYLSGQIASENIGIFSFNLINLPANECLKIKINPLIKCNDTSLGRQRKLQPRLKRKKFRS
jgi:hypothetical protein